MALAHSPDAVRGRAAGIIAVVATIVLALLVLHLVGRAGRQVSAEA